MSQRYIGGLATLNPPIQNPALGNAANGVFSMSQYFSLKTQGSWPAIDPYYPYVTLNLHGNGTNGAQNNTFLDSSTNNFTITRNGNTTQGTFTPYGSNWSNYFDGSGDTLSAPDNAALEFGSGNFTIEAFFYTTSTSSQTIIAKWATSNLSWFLGFGSGLGFYINVGAGGVLALPLSSVPANQWNHIAVTRSGADLKLFLNGTQSGSTYNIGSSTILDTSATVVVAGDGSGNPEFVGYISNVRILKGTAQYTSNFTPPTSPLTAITNTSLLTCQSNRFIDNSSNAFTITVTGNTAIQRFSPFNPTTPYAAGTIGGSGYFDGSGDYLTVPDNAALTLSADFTIEFWFYQNSSGVQGFLQHRSANNSFSTGDFQIQDNSTTVLFNTPGGSVATGTYKTNAWNHYALVRSGSTITAYLNGVSQNTLSSSVSYTGNGNIVRIGELFDGTHYYFNGLITDLRIVKGTAVYTSNFTPPTAPLTAITNTSLLLNFTNGGIIDNAMMNDLETVGNAQISTSVSKFGGGSLAFDGNGDWLIVASSPNFSFGTGNFTIEGWVYLNNVSGFQTVVAKTYGWGPFAILSNGTSLLYYLSSTGSSWDIANGGNFGTVAAGAWYHFALVRNGSIFTAYLNGVSGGTTTSSAALVENTRTLIVGGIRANDDSIGSPLNGYIDDLRITKGYARYTANFTPQTSQWQDQ